jgi:hypothetical protein
MTRTILFHRIVAVVAVALALATAAGPASARTFDLLDSNSTGSLVQQPAPSASPRANPATSGTGIQWGYIAIGASAAALVLIGVGVAATGRRRSREDSSQRATITG